jgi:hypothetical protein
MFCQEAKVELGKDREQVGRGLVVIGRYGQDVGE